MNNSIIFATNMQENRGRKRKYSFDFKKGEIREYPSSETLLLRPAISKFIKSDAPLWKFKSCIVGDKLLIQRIK